MFCVSWVLMSITIDAIFIDFNYAVKKAWMNTRDALIKKYKIKDKSYEKEWLDLEENNKKLDQNYTVFFCS